MNPLLYSSGRTARPYEFMTGERLNKKPRQGYEKPYQTAFKRRERQKTVVVISMERHLQIVGSLDQRHEDVPPGEPRVGNFIP